MKKILGMMIAVLMICGVASAEIVNLTKVGTPWVWKVENGVSSFDGFVLVEDGTLLVSEAGDRTRLEVEEYWFLYAESGDKILTEKDELVLADKAVATNYEPLYLQLVGQGWTVTESPATVPQALSEASASLLRLGLVEDGTFFALENTNNLKLEN